MRVVLNGEPRDLRDGSMASDAVEASGAQPDGRGVAVAVDGEVVPRGAWTSTELREGQQIEVLRAVQGG
jgi:sulfur carrier protein